MKSIILYYTFGGSTKKEAERLAVERKAPLVRVRDVHNYSMVSAFVLGAFRAMRRRKGAIGPVTVNLEDYDRILIGAPIWAGYPAPAFNAIVDRLPAGKEVELFFCSQSGNSPQCESVKEDITKKGCTVVSYREICTKGSPIKMRE
jgi:hypothetical protein